MNRFTQMLVQGFKNAGVKVEIWHPKVYLGKLTASTLSGFGKWLGYLDKWIVFPLILRKRLLKRKLNATNTYFHICDHSNAPYLKYLPAGQSGITCHDVLAIRGGFGFSDAYCPATKLGKVLQRWILSNLCRAQFLACVSHFTFSQLTNLKSGPVLRAQRWRVIHNSFNGDFGPISKEQASTLVSNAGLEKERSFLLHVGSSLARKNRKLLVDLIAILGSSWQGNICYAGEAVDEELLEYARSLNLQSRIVSVVKPDHATLVALYNSCDALVFPSFSEGFGWPIIEAQACGAPVIASNKDPLPEVSGNAALHADPTKPEQFAAAYLSLQNKRIRADLIEKGYKNTKRFDSAIMIAAYLDLYGINKF